MERRYVALVGLVLAAGALAANLPGVARGSTPYALFRALLWLCTLHVVCAAFGVLVRQRSERTVTAALTVVALFALAAHVDFGRLHGGGRALHHHELFNYFIGSKYFPELGYDGHYLATHRALIENDPSLHAEIKVVKNLRTYQMEARTISLQRSESVAASFTAARWREFCADVARFQAVVPRDTWPFLMVDHGYNATPFWTLLGRTFSTRLAPGTGTLRLCAALDVALLAAALGLAAWGFGRRIALLCAVFYLATFFGTFEFTGGAFLRQVWFLGLVGFVACWHRDRPVAAGLFLAVAALDRVFPILFAAVPAVLLAREALVHRALRRDAARLLAACAAAVIVLGLASGTGVWVECWRNLTAHSRWFFLNQISLRTLFLVDPAATLAMVRAGWDESVWLRERQDLDAATRGTLLALRAVLAGLVLWRCARRGNACAGLGLAAFLPFVLLYPANYYFTLLVVPLLCLDQDRLLALAVVAHEVVFWLLQALLPPPVYLELLNWAVSLVLCATLLCFLGGEFPGALRGAGRRRAQGALALLLFALAAGVAWDVARHRARPPAVELDLVAADVSTRGGARAENQLMGSWGSGWSRNDHVSVLASAPGARADIALDVPAAGRYDLRLELTTAPPYGEVACALDGAAPFAVADLYAPQPGVRAVVAAGLELAAGPHALQLTVAGQGPAASGCNFGLDRVLLAPALARAPAEARDRALAWVLAHPADLFDGGRKGLCAELIALERLRDAPGLAGRRAELESQARRRLSTLNACPGDFALAPEAALLAAAGCAARRLGGDLAVLSVARADVEAQARAAYGERSLVPPLSVRAWLARLDGAEPEPAEGGAAPLLFALAGEPADPAREARLACDLAREVAALTDLGRAPAPGLALAPAELASVLDLGLRRALARGDVLTAARLLLAASSLDLDGEVPAYGSGIQFLLAQQLASGSFGRADPTAPDPEREAVLTALLVLATAD